MRGYGKDLAYVHDAGFSGLARKAAPGLLALLRGAGITGGLVVDLGCGSGIWASALLRAGYDVLGIDLSAAMIDMARKAAPHARAVTSIGECINYQFDARNGGGRLAALFAREHEALRPGGILVLDFAEPGRGGEGSMRCGFWKGDNREILVEVEEDRERARLTRRMTTFRKVGRLYRRTAETHRLRLYRKKEVAALLRRAGFRARHIGGYGWLEFARGHSAIVARRPRE